MGELNFGNRIETTSVGLCPKRSVVLGSRRVISFGPLESYFAIARSSRNGKDESLSGLGAQARDSNESSVSRRDDLARCPGTFSVQQMVLHVGETRECSLSDGSRHASRGSYGVGVRVGG